MLILVETNHGLVANGTSPVPVACGRAGGLPRAFSTPLGPRRAQIKSLITNHHPHVMSSFLAQTLQAERSRINAVVKSLDALATTLEQGGRVDATVLKHAFESLRVYAGHGLSFQACLSPPPPLAERNYTD